MDRTEQGTQQGKGRRGIGEEELQMNEGKRLSSSSAATTTMARRLVSLVPPFFPLIFLCCTASDSLLLILLLLLLLLTSCLVCQMSLVPLSSPNSSSTSPLLLVFSRVSSPLFQESPVEGRSHQFSASDVVVIARSLISRVARVRSRIQSPAPSTSSSSLSSACCCRS